MVHVLQGWNEAFKKAATLSTIQEEYMFARELTDLDREETVDEALDLAFDQIDDAFLEGRFDWVDQFLKIADVESMSVSLLVGILTITASAESKLRHRSEFRKRAENVIRKRGRYNDTILRDL
ncbi:MAG TPA: hypothetical protein DDZ51_03565 [Planctomycetaceae bacterium]|nr:hypothetical protein [Planctomycetaceae bacterium]